MHIGSNQQAGGRGRGISRDESFWFPQRIGLGIGSAKNRHPTPLFSADPSISLRWIAPAGRRTSPLLHLLEGRFVPRGTFRDQSERLWALAAQGKYPPGSVLDQNQRSDCQFLLHHLSRQTKPPKSFAPTFHKFTAHVFGRHRRGGSAILSLRSRIKSSNSPRRSVSRSFSSRKGSRRMKSM